MPFSARLCATPETHTGSHARAHTHTHEPAVEQMMSRARDKNPGCVMWTVMKVCTQRRDV